MKTTFTEHGSSFVISFQAENIQEAAFLTRLGMNTRNSKAIIQASAYADGSFGAFIELGKYKNSVSAIPKRR